eukprot:COSAG05_NODE_9059_length_650_cov_0.836661_2_plen_96_part_01
MQPVSVANEDAVGLHLEHEDLPELHELTTTELNGLRASVKQQLAHELNIDAAQIPDDAISFAPGSIIIRVDFGKTGIPKEAVAKARQAVAVGVVAV